MPTKGLRKRRLALSHNTTRRPSIGKPVHYVHKSGEDLDVELYELPELVNLGGTHKYITVALAQLTDLSSLVTMEPKPVGNQQCVMYCIWEGAGSRDANGWEEYPSVSKAFGTRNSELDEHNAHSTAAEKQRRHRRTIQTSYKFPLRARYQREPGT